MEPEPHTSAEQRRPLQAALEETVGAKEARKLQARRAGPQDAWFGLGMFGLVGWSVALPTLLGVAAGVWLDTTWHSRFSWTLMLLGLGICLGCVNAWYWVTRESRRD